MDENIGIRVERIHKLDSNKPLRGFADVSIAGSFIIKGLRIVNGREGMFVGMPQELGKDGKWYNTVSLTDESLKKKLADVILAAFAD
ncbi:septation protein SpoVG family protein [Candidatus Omnitrophota bacterium]